MQEGYWLSLLLGAGIGAAYGGLALLMNRRALRRTGSRFTAAVFGGMLVRMVLLLVAVGLVAALVPIQVLPFLLALVTALVLGLALELFMVYRSLGSGRDT